MANLSNILTFVFAAPMLKGFTTTFVNVLAAIMISRLLWSIIGKSADLFKVSSSALGCHSVYTEQEGHRYAIAWIMLLLYDAVILSLTFWKALSIRKLGSSQFSHVIIRDGSLYFFGMSMANLSNILTFMLASPVLKGVSTAFSNVLAATMISRLLLNVENPKLFESGLGFSIGETVDISTFNATVQISPTAFCETVDDTLSSRLTGAVDA
ncbi:hypothetical protein EW145_g4257 [Phellinidium pouzarii]|uniref:Uncharacterized protein n=1 Tax=Phellinidium pouzarii TaxID=167371 RepID=A0A4S4L4C2_9AGAM|nr:hypothetical protein EW145_g4257 [Phellinidium pouzarii]